MKVFLGGTCNESTWRDRIITYLDDAGIEYFNPIVEDWTEDCMVEEIKQRGICDICLYAVTPRMTGVFSIAEVVDDSNKRPDKTVFICLRDDDELRFDDSQWHSLMAVARMVERNGGYVSDSLKGTVGWMEKNKKG